MEKRDKLEWMESLFIQPGSEELDAFTDWHTGLREEELERLIQATSAFCLQWLGRSREDILKDSKARLDRGDRSRNPEQEAMLIFTYSVYRARQAARGRDGQ